MATRRKHYYVTTYHVGNTPYGCHIYATSTRQAEAIARKRNIGERVEGRGEAPVKKYGLTPIQKLHQATFLGWIGIKAGLLTEDDVVGDRGLVHEMIHMMETADDQQEELDENYSAYWKLFHTRFEKLQRLIPGWLS